jgi:hypothetical protein
VLCLIESNPHVKKLEIYEHEHVHTYDARVFGNLAQHCCEVGDVTIKIASAEAVRLVMVSFPNIRSIFWENYQSSPIQMPSHDINSYPTIESFYVYAWYATDAAAVTLMIKACPNLTSLECDGPWLLSCLSEILISCNRLAKLHLHSHNPFDGSERFDIPSMMWAIAEHGLQLKELEIEIGMTSIALCSLQPSLAKIMKRLKSFKFSLRVEHDNSGDPDRSICSIFRSPDIDLHSLLIDTAEESVDLTMIFRSCRNA